MNFHTHFVEYVTGTFNILCDRFLDHKLYILNSIGLNRTFDIKQAIKQISMKFGMRALYISSAILMSSHIEKLHRVGDVTPLVVSCSCAESFLNLLYSLCWCVTLCVAVSLTFSAMAVAPSRFCSKQSLGLASTADQVGFVIDKLTLKLVNLPVLPSSLESVQVADSPRSQICHSQQSIKARRTLRRSLNLSHPITSHKDRSNAANVLFIVVLSEIFRVLFLKGRLKTGQAFQPCFLFVYLSTLSYRII